MIHYAFFLGGGLKKIPGVARGCLDTIPGFFTFPTIPGAMRRSFEKKCFTGKKSFVSVTHAPPHSPRHVVDTPAPLQQQLHRRTPHNSDKKHWACEGAGSFFDGAMLQSALLAACEKLLDQSMPLMFREIVSGQLLASRS